MAGPAYGAVTLRSGRPIRPKGRQSVPVGDAPVDRGAFLATCLCERQRRAASLGIVPNFWVRTLCAEVRSRQP